MEIPVCNRRCIDLQKKVRRPAGIALPFSTFQVAQRIGAISNKQIFFLLLCHSFYVPFQEDICYSEHMRGISCHLQGILPPYGRQNDMRLQGGSPLSFRARP